MCSGEPPWLHFLFNLQRIRSQFFSSSILVILAPRRWPFFFFLIFATSLSRRLHHGHVPPAPSRRRGRLGPPGRRRLQHRRARSRPQPGRRKRPRGRPAHTLPRHPRRRHHSIPPRLQRLDKRQPVQSSNPAAHVALLPLLRPGRRASVRPRCGDKLTGRRQQAAARVRPGAALILGFAGRDLDRRGLGRGPGRRPRRWPQELVPVKFCGGSIHHGHGNGHAHGLFDDIVILQFWHPVHDKRLHRSGGDGHQDGERGIVDGHDPDQLSQEQPDAVRGRRLRQDVYPAVRARLQQQGRHRRPVEPEHDHHGRVRAGLRQQRQLHRGWLGDVRGVRRVLAQEQPGHPQHELGLVFHHRGERQKSVGCGGVVADI